MVPQSSRQKVSVVHCNAGMGKYPSICPFHPSEAYPEYGFTHFEQSAKNLIYDAVRESFTLMELDPVNVNTASWNPLAFLIQPGDTVIVKPNLIRENHLYNDEWEQVITHGSIVRAVTDYILLALNGKGKIIITDGPQTDSSFDKICMNSGLYSIVDFYKRHSDVEVSLLDLRSEEWLSRDGVVVEKRELAGDPKGYSCVDLGEHSELIGHAGEGRYYGADYDMAETNLHHSMGKHEYLVSSTVLDADVFINLPKLKTHKKTGITCSLKNIVGISSKKNWLPHHTLGFPSQGGDQSCKPTSKNKLETVLLRKYKDLLLHAPNEIANCLRHLKKVGEAVFGRTEQVIRSGNWYGNDTIWRTVIDLNKVLFYANLDGTLNRHKTRRYFSLVDGIIAGEGNGPMAPDKKNVGLLIAGLSPVAVDCVCSKFMGFDYRKIPMLYKAFSIGNFPLVDFQYGDIEVISNDEKFHGPLVELDNKDMFSFRPHFGWEGHVELEAK